MDKQKQTKFLECKSKEEKEKKKIDKMKTNEMKTKNTIRNLIFKTILLICLFLNFIYASNIDVLGIYVSPKAKKNKIFDLIDFQDKPKIVSVFAIWCQPCKKELNLLAKLQKLYPNVYFVGIHSAIKPNSKLDYTKLDLIEFLKQTKTYPSNIVLTSSIFANNNDIVYPFTFVLDKNNIVVKRLKGFTKANKKYLEQWLKNQ